MRHIRILSIDDPQAIPAAVQTIQGYGTIVFPTDTIYGIAADTFHPEAINHLYEIKGRPSDKALPILIGESSQLECLVRFVSDEARQIADAFWPGALTLILPKSPDIPPELSPYPTIGVRMPALGFTMKLLMETGPLATTSANLSGGPNPTTVQDVRAQLGDRPDLILDGGATPGPQASTVVDASGPALKILREGPISLAAIEEVLERKK